MECCVKITWMEAENVIDLLLIEVGFLRQTRGDLFKAINVTETKQW